MTEWKLPEWQSLTTSDIEEIIKRDPVAVLPLAAVEQHGPHLPLSTDLEIGRGILQSAFDLLPADFPALVLPAQPIGSSAEHLSFSGTLSFDDDLMTAVIVEVGRGLSSAGVRRLVLSNAHGGNRAAMDLAGLRLRREEGLLVVKASYFNFPPPEGIEISETEWRHGLHGGTVETSMMLHLRPDLVHTDQIVKSRSMGKELEAGRSRIGSQGSASFSWLAEDLSSSGVVGDARLADAEKGRLLIEHYARTLSGVIEDTLAFPLERLV